MQISVTNKIKETFNQLKFDSERHTYTVNGNKYISVSELLKEFVKPFESKKIAAYVAASKCSSVEDILKDWNDIKNEACRFGTRVHDFGERYAKDRYNVESKITFYSVHQHLVKGEKLSPQEEALVKFWNDKPDYIIPVILEAQMYSIHWEYAGTADIVLLDTRDNTLIIADYKTNKDLYKQYKDQMLLGIFSHLNDNPLSKYEIQLSFYQILLEQTGYKVSRRFLIWLKADGEYEIINTTDYTERLTQFLHKRKINGSW